MFRDRSEIFILKICHTNLPKSPTSKQEAANILIGMLDGYVDNVCPESTSLRMGTRWDADAKKFTIDADAK